ncbi:hypothetical protein IFM89_001064 [Coptis chinensis]|uniref:Uncharacterized protein n=1 Tax=Coptis chinensis TaxID=261450 RepID=A0A835HC84_9MAGN|nr:hypothetical protein IFM89_001064 [Coptis chinensis]
MFQIRQGCLLPSHGFSVVVRRLTVFGNLRIYAYFQLPKHFVTCYPSSSMGCLGIHHKPFLIESRIGKIGCYHIPLYRLSSRNGDKRTRTVTSATGSTLLKISKGAELESHSKDSCGSENPTTENQNGELYPFSAGGFGFYGRSADWMPKASLGDLVVPTGWRRWGRPMDFPSFCAFRPKGLKGDNRPTAHPTSSTFLTTHLCLGRVFSVACFSPLSHYLEKVSHRFGTRYYHYHRTIRHPIRIANRPNCKSGALPTELYPRAKWSMHEGVRCFFYSPALGAILDLNQRPRP